MDRPADYNSYIKSAQWRNICDLKKRLAGNKCERCGHTSARLEVHHLTYERFKQERLADLLVVCHECHLIEDEKRAIAAKKKNEAALYNARLEGYMRKKYGEDFVLDGIITCEHYDEFDEWLEKQEEKELRDL
jgi:hypothetical protein